jgi:hypothetical protein
MRGSCNLFISLNPSSEVCARYHSKSVLINEDDAVAAAIAVKKLLDEKDLLIKRHLRAAEESNNKARNPYLSRPSERMPPWKMKSERHENAMRDSMVEIQTQHGHPSAHILNILYLL